MDFARPLVSTASVASQSKIQHLDDSLVEASSTEGDDATRIRNQELDRRVVRAANQAARDMFMGNDASETTELEHPKDAWLVDASRYTERTTPIINHGLIQAGDLVVIQESFDKLDFVYVKEKSIYQNRNGAFHHNDFINQPFGTKVRSRDLQGYGFIYVLKPTPELWTRSLNHRTQVVHELDQSQIIFQLYISPNDVVVESGTGSGAMSHAILRSVAPSGHLHTFEFNQHRAQAAKAEFEQHGLSHLVTVHHKDVCRGLVESIAGEATDTNDNGPTTRQQGTPGFDLPGQSVDAVFLDLPEPWWAVPHAAYCLKPNSRIASYSPCVEQTQKTIAALEQCGFHSIKTMEYRLMEHYVDEVVYESPPSRKRPRVPPHNVASYHEAPSQPPTRSGTDEDDNGDTCDDTDADVGTTEKSEPDHTEMEASSTGVSNENETNAKKVLVARPFVMMRGHSAFLTFATAGLEIQPDPNDSSHTTGTTAATGNNEAKATSSN